MRVGSIHSRDRPGFRTLRVVELTQRFPPALGGVETHVAALAERLRASGVVVRVATTDLERDRPFRRLSTQEGSWPFAVDRYRAVRLFPAPRGLGVVAPGMLFDLLRTRTDLVHAHAFGYAPTWIGALARRLRGVPLVVETHADAGRGTSGTRTYGRLTARGTLAVADRVVARTPAEVRVLSDWGVSPGKITVIPGGIDLEEFERAPSRNRTDEGRTLVLLYLGRIDPEQKGLATLLRAFARLRSDLRPELRLVGEDWGGTSDLGRLARELGVADRTIFTGPVPRAQVLQEFVNADVFVLPSHFEPYGIVLMEAMACGRPVVASRVGGIPDVVGEAALLVPPADPDALAGALERLGDDPGLRERLGAQGRERVERYRWENVLPHWLRLFEDVVR